MTEIRLYIEGGGGKESKARLRLAFSRFLGEIQEEARRRRVRWQIVLCGSRSQTYEDFRLALRTHPDAWNLLLVDAERPVTRTPQGHLTEPAPDGDGWNLSSITDEQCHLMVQAMEAWLIADPEALAAFYGQGFAANALPKTKNVEKIPKDRLASSLANATRNTQRREYHKTRHAPQILERLDPGKVRSRASHCERLFTTINEQLSKG